MNTEMAYLLGMVLGNGEIQRNGNETTVTIDIPHKNLRTDDGKDASVYVSASLIDIEDIIKPLVGTDITHGQGRNSTQISFTKKNDDYTLREIVRLVGFGTNHKFMKMPSEAFKFTHDEKIALLRGFADVTAYIRRSNMAFSSEGQHRVYIEIPSNWDMVIDLANLLKTVDIPIQTIDFGHPNFRDSKAKKYNEGHTKYWKKEHQIKIWANEFLPIGFNIKHKQEALEKYAEELLQVLNPETTHEFYWQKRVRSRPVKISHPAESDDDLPSIIRGRHFNSWTELAAALGYHE